MIQQGEQLEVAALNGSVRCKLVQQEGKQRMTAAEFLKGMQLDDGIVLG